MSQFIREIEPRVELFRDAVTGIAWAEDHRTGLGVSVHPNIDENGSVEGMVARGYWRSSDRVARSHGWIYNIDRFVCNDEDPVEAIVAEECMCPACIERRAAQRERKRYACPVCHNTDQSKMNVTRRTCGYLGENYWNVGKTKEIKSRVLHL